MHSGLLFANRSATGWIIMDGFGLESARGIPIEPRHVLRVVIGVGEQAVRRLREPFPSAEWPSAGQRVAGRAHAEKSVGRRRLGQGRRASSRQPN
jgi:hypothetical protein